MTSEGSVESASFATRWAVVARHGRTATAFRAVGPDLAVWVPPGTPEALVPYAPTGRAAVAAGEPVAALDALVPVAEAFVAAQRAAGRRTCFFATEGRLASSPQLARRLVGEQPAWDPRRWDMHVRAHRSLREQLRRARAKRVIVHRITPAHLARAPWRAAVDALLARWRATRSMAAMHFLVHVDLTDGDAQGLLHRRCYVAVQDAELVGLLALAPVPARDGWLFEHLLRDPDAPNGTAELLVDHAMRDLSAAQVPWATLGLAPLHGPIDRSLARVRRLARPLFNFTGLSAFKRKLDPDGWEPIYLAWPREQSGWLALVDGLRAFAGGSLGRFGVATLLRGPRPILQALVVLLVPWTLLLALLPTAPWFPSRTVQLAWVGFDLALLLALVRLLTLAARHGAAARRATARWATGVAVAVSLDALCTAGEAIGWRSSWQAGVGGRVGTIVACLGPLVAAAVLWGAARRARRLAGARPRVPAEHGGDG